MLNRNQFMNKYPNITDGMTVYSQDGEKLGKIAFMDDDSFVVEKGLFFPKDFSARYDDISEIRDNSIILNYPHTDLSAWRQEDYKGWSEYDRLSTAGTGTSDTSRTMPSSSDNLTVPIVEEELEARKVIRDRGNVNIRKVVHTELRNITVPVMKEDIRIERVPVTERSEGTLSAEQASFKDETISIPIREEDVELSKRSVVKEEVRISKDRHEEERTLSGEVRKEDVTVENEELLRKRKAG